jgi:hypothetical protein
MVSDEALRNSAKPRDKPLMIRRNVVANLRMRKERFIWLSIKSEKCFNATLRKDYYPANMNVVADDPSCLNIQ